MAMKTMMSRQMKLASMFDQESQKKRRLEDASPSADPDASMSPQADMTDAELAAVKKRIPKPPKLNFKKVDLSTITYKESNDNGTVGVAVSGIPNAGRGLFNLSPASIGPRSPWSASSGFAVSRKKSIMMDSTRLHGAESWVRRLLS
ncbi:hypothetical protein PINS_up022984 [Pythium insidiosum]|nr:hypothetical protein PINS_up022984 [Pythium insidiosum]